MTFTAKVSGASQLIRQLNKLKLAASDRVSKAATRAGGAVYLKAARKNLPKRTGSLRRSMRQLVRVNRENNGHLSVIGSDKRKGPGSRYLHLVGKGALTRIARAEKQKAAAAYAKKFREALSKEV